MRMVELISETKKQCSKITDKHDSLESMSTAELKELRVHLRTILGAALLFVEPSCPVQQVAAAVGSFEDIVILLSKRSAS
jgi:hypothetical protein